MFRWPRLPVIIISPQGVAAAADRRQLARVLAGLPESSDAWDVRVVDPTGWEFWFSTKDHVLAPGFAVKRWTKRQLIDLYNESRHGDQRRYEVVSLQNYRFERIVNEIARLVTLNTGRHESKQKSDIP